MEDPDWLKVKKGKVDIEVIESEGWRWFVDREIKGNCSWLKLMEILQESKLEEN